MKTFFNKLVCIPLALTSWRSTANLGLLLCNGQKNLSILMVILFVAGVITSILNHSLTNTPMMWVDRGLMIFIVALIMGPLILGQTTPKLVHVQTFFASLHFLWSKLNSSQESIRIEAHKASHQDGTLVMFSMGL